MSLIVETGAGLSNGESYQSVIGADTYHSNFGNSAWALLNDSKKEQLLRQATQYMIQEYRTRWKGYRAKAGQALDWPRMSIYKQDGVLNEFVDWQSIPVEVSNTCAILALKAATTTLNPDMTQAVVREKLGPMETEYSEFSQQGTRFVEVDAMLLPFLKSNTGSISASLCR